MPDNLKEVAHALPFMLPAAAAGVMEGDHVVNKTRVLEAIIIAAILGVLSVASLWFLLIPELKTEFRHLSVDVQELRTDQTGVRAELKQLQIDVASNRYTKADHAAHLAREHPVRPD